MFKAGLISARFVTVDDTGARHPGKTCLTTRSALTISPSSAPGRGNRAKLS